ncbi:MAG: hypothetical protein IKM28_07750 [Lachnospiraceae bacterium]|nr:hypothetical protein [Lachnospiraceae bacterium]
MGKNKAIILGAITGMLLEISLILGRGLMGSGQKGILWCLIELLLWSGGFGLLYYFLWNQESRERNRSFRMPEEQWHWLLVWLGMFLCYLPCYAAFFPGIMSYDSKRITEQALGLRPFDNFQPFMHTILWTFCVRLEQWCGIKQMGIVLYSVAQMLALTAVFTCVLYYMVKRQVHKGLVIGTFVMYAFCPSIVLFSFITTKDILFGAFVLLMVLLLMELCRDTEEFFEGRVWMVCFILTGLAACLFRNNMIYVVLLTAAVVVPVFRSYWRYTGIMFLSIILGYWIITGPIYWLLGVQPGYAREMLSVPLSQLANVYQEEKEDLDAEDRELMLKYIPDIEKYERQFADPIKLTFHEEEYKKKKGEFWSLWWKYLKQEPRLYAEAFLVLNAPLWYMESDTVDPYISLGLFSRHYTFEYKDALPTVRKLYTAVAEYDKAEKGLLRWPIIRQFFSVALPVWVLLAAGCTLGAEGRWKRMIPLLPLLLLWMTYLLGPVSNFRYMFPIIISYPLILMLVLDKEKKRSWMGFHYVEKWWKV